MKTQPLTAEIHQQWGWRPYMKPHALPMAGCSYSLETWPHKPQCAGWWAVYGFVDDFGEVWVKTSH